MLQLQSRSTFSYFTYAVIQRNLFTPTVVSLRVKGMGPSKRSIASSLNSDTRDKKLKGSVGITSSDNEFVKGMPYDPQEIVTMTVKELRSALRSVGVPARGLKSDLVSALRCFLDQKPDGSLDIKTDSEAVSVDGDNVHLTSEGSHKNIDTVLEDFKFSGSKKSVKQSLGSDETIQAVAKASTRKQKSSIRNEEVSGQELLRAKRSVSSKVVNEVLDANKIDDSVNQIEPWTIFAHKKPQKDWIAYNPRTMRPPPLSSDVKSVKLMSWNVNGLRALLKLERFSALQLAKREDFDVLCLQETKLQEKDVEAIRDTLIDGYDHSFWTCSVSKLGYSGTAIISRVKPLSVTYGLGSSDHDSEGRLVTAEFDLFYLLSAYVPNSGDGLRRLSYRITEWDQALGSYIKELEKTKPVILTGDLNCAHEEIDIYNPAGNKRSAGFTIEERQSFEKNFLSQGFVDTFRKQHPGVVGYTYWGYRHGGRKSNKGWRLDYFLVSESIANKVHDSYILPDVTGSDHSPIGLILQL